MKHKLITYITSTQIFETVVLFLKKIKFKQDQVSLYEVITIFIEKVTKDSVIDKAEAVAFNFTLALFPGIIFLFTLIPFVQQWIPNVNPDAIMTFLQEMIPASMFETIEHTIADIVGKQRGGLLTFGVLFSLVMSTNGMLALMRAFNACYKTEDKRGFFRTRAVATGLTLMLAFVLFLASILLFVGDIVIDKVNSELDWLHLDSYLNLFLIVRFIVIFIVFFLAISFMYYFGPSIHYNWRFFSIGSLLATILCLGISYLFSYYITNFGTYNKLYGSIGVLIALMVWQFILSIMLLVGYEINASIHKAHSDYNDESDGGSLIKFPGQEVINS